MPDLPELRREVVVTDYDSGEPVTHTMHFYRCGRVDQYRVEANGKPWKDRIGWSKALAKLRQAYQRVPSARSDVWR